MVTRSFYFLRHGETDWNLEQRMQGHTDVPLNANGRRQAAEVVDVLKKHPIDRIITSNLSRAHETAKIVNKFLQKPITVDEALRERHFGIVEGRTWDEIAEFRQIMQLDKLPLEENGHPCAPQAETYADFKQRTTEVITRYLDAHEGENILFVSHGGVYRVLNRLFSGLLDQTPNAQPLHFAKDGDSWVIKVLD